MAYDQYPYKVQVDGGYDTKAYVWCLQHIEKGLWTVDYNRPHAFKFTLEKDYVMFLLRWS